MEVKFIRTKLAEYRVQLGFTQEMLAEKVGCTKQLLNNIENGRRLGTIKFWLKLQKSLCLSNDELVELMKESVEL